MGCPIRAWCIYCPWEWAVLAVQLRGWPSCLGKGLSTCALQLHSICTMTITSNFLHIQTQSLAGWLKRALTTCLWKGPSQVGGSLGERSCVADATRLATLSQREPCTSVWTGQACTGSLTRVWFFIPQRQLDTHPVPRLSMPPPFARVAGSQEGWSS